MIIDAHTHLGTFNNKSWTPQQLISSMDQAQIDVSLVIASTTFHIPTTTLLTMCKNYQRLKVIGSIDFPTISKKQIELLCKLLDTQKIYGIKLYPGYQNFYPQDKKLAPLYAYCEKNDYPIVIHTGLLEINQPGLLRQSHPLNVDDVANQFPNLKIVMAHMGNPWTTDCGAILYKRKNVYTDISGFFEEYKPLESSAIKSFVKCILYLKEFTGGFDKFLFGTDFPLYSQKEYLKAAKSLPLTHEDGKKVFTNNAKRVFNIK